MTPILKTAIAAACAAAFAAAPAAIAQAQQQDKSQRQAQQQDKAQQKSQLGKQDRQSMQKMAEANMAEVAAGKVAQEKASSEQVKEFAQHMVEDHGKALEEMQAMAQSKNAKLPDEPSRRHQSATKKLEGLSGAEFDRQYMAQMVKDHQDALKEARRAAKEAKDPELKAAAQKAAQDIQQHLDKAKSLHASLGGTKASRGASGREDAGARQGAGGPGGQK